MFHLAGADAECQRAERAVRGGVGVSADDDHAGQRQPLFWADHVNDALPDVAHVEDLDAGRAAVILERRDLSGGDGVINRPATVGGGDVVIGHGDGRRSAPHRAPGQSQALERLWRGDFMGKVTVHVQEGSAVFLGPHDVRIPDLLEHGLGCHVVLLTLRFRRLRRSLRERGSETALPLSDLPEPRKMEAALGVW